MTTLTTLAALIPCRAVRKSGSLCMPATDEREPHMNSFTGRVGVTSTVHLADLWRQRNSADFLRPLYTATQLPIAQPSATAATVVRGPECVPRLRRIGAAWLRHACRMPDTRVEAALVVLSELITNAVLHGEQDSVEYRSWSQQPGLIRIEIDDGTEAEEPQPQQASPMAESGRGLLFVDMLVRDLGGDWGFCEGGTTAWLCLPIHENKPASGRGEL
ncbi:ATP-binding protein [[Kitasatospora] papulosa]|uniref:ATP-binding protein n=1 Tax=[Kitasatospora] papulosa TaxID=1464011 RepID=UPI0036CA3FC8